MDSFRGLPKLDLELKYTEPFLVPVDQWFHIIFSWDGNKLFL